MRDLAIDLANFRTVPQSSELAAVEAMIGGSADRFWALTESLFEDGYLPTESVIVLRAKAGRKGLLVKEGNRRVAALKILLGLLPMRKFSVPKELADRIRPIGKSWRAANTSIPCTIYAAGATATVDRIVRLAHGKGEKASRDQWNAVARARHNRDVNKGSEPALDLLESYLAEGKNVTHQERARWAGDYPLTVLEEAMKRLARRLGVASAPALPAAYPATSLRDALEAVLHAIGERSLGFEVIRGQADFAVPFGFPADSKQQAGSKGAQVVARPPLEAAVAVPEDEGRALRHTLQTTRDR